MKTYGVVFGGGDPRLNSGLSPTFLLFYRADTGVTLAPPGITEIFVGSGQYRFQYGPTIPIFFLIDGGAALAASSRYVSGDLDPIQAVDEQVGMPDASIGSTSVDPTSLFGYAKRNQEFLEGNQVYLKATGVWNIYSRGSSTLLATKTLTNDTTDVTRS